MVNGCSFFPDKIFGYTITPACNNHDANYWFQKINRKEADTELRKDVNKILPFWLGFIGWIMYFGARIGGWFFWNKYKGGENGKNKNN